ncbi:nuclease-related domain-containing protein [Rossellomorea aquimaris]|uniref:nuclease-related domain-containing protein n=1 Tax=Rossellomorea aquimaris TaxID=189382 RepID=UPI0007D0A30C|nr:nuclease-related domain-containing protein [Rossellomorea aquimaris]
MIIKNRKIPLSILYNQALIRRISPDSIHLPQIQADLLKLWAGYHGECKVDRHLSTIDNPDLFILNDLCLPIGSTFFQIDSLILSKSFSVIIEVKNIAGVLEIGGEFEQLSRTINGETTGFTNPLSQAKRYKIHLLHWMKMKKIPMLPVEYLVVFTNSSSILNSMKNSQNNLKRIIRVENLVPTFMSLQQKYSIVHLINKQLKRLTNLLNKSHIQYPNNMTEEKIIKGVQCTSCLEFSMIRNQSSWFCPNCEIYDKKAHEQAIYDYLLLKHPTINNKKAREFLRVDSPKVIHRLLNNMNLASRGEKKARVYFLPDY